MAGVDNSQCLSQFLFSCLWVFFIQEIILKTLSWHQYICFIDVVLFHFSVTPSFYVTIVSIIVQTDSVKD